MRERRQHQRVPIDGWVSLQHPLLGTVTAEVRDISAGGMSLRLDEDRNFFVMMELEAKIHSRETRETVSMQSVQVVRVQNHRIGLRFNGARLDRTPLRAIRKRSRARPVLPVCTILA